MRSREVTSLGRARREFLRRESPWAIGVGILVLAVIRVLVGDPSWRDAVAVAAMIAIYPFGEWAIHVYLLHAKPIRIRGRKVETMAARAHRAHHEEPNDLDMVLLYWWQAAFLMVLAVPIVAGLGALLVTLLAGPVPLGALITAGLAGFCMVFLYEWTHFLIHTAYLPRTRVYRTDPPQPPAAPLQERALLARGDQQPERSRAGHATRTSARWRSRTPRGPWIRSLMTR